MKFPILAYVDLETTGTRTGSDRITEIAIIRQERGEVVERWSSLVDPEVPIPDPIQQLTGITDTMVADAPAFGQLIPDIVRLLDSAALVAHNARFDAGFLRQAFARRDLPFDYEVLCTLRLSRALYPQHKRHNLDTLIQRHGIEVRDRHRAMTDTQVLPQLLDKWVAQHGRERVEQLLVEQLKRENLPPHLDPDLLDSLPRGPGVYLFFGEKGVPLYVGKSVDIRSRVLSHFSDAKRSDKELRMSEEVRDIQWVETAGELSALIREAELVKELSPIFNRRLRRHKSLFSWRWQIGESSEPALLDLADAQHARAGLQDQYGLFRSKKAAEKALHAVAAEQGLCQKTLGLEKGKGPCFAYQLKRCKGACVGEESHLQHGLRVAEALLPMRVMAWPYPNAVGIVEQNPHAGINRMLVVDRWRILASLEEGEAFDPAGCAPAPLDLDIYQILTRFLKSGKGQIVSLDDTRGENIAASRNLL
jgi:DNA polymerase-3 subunit epsilon